MSKFSRVMLSCSIALLLVGICYGSLIGQSRRRGVAPSPASSDPTLEYLMGANGDEANITLDTSGNDYTGTVVNATWLVATNGFANNYSFDGSGDYIDGGTQVRGGFPDAANVKSFTISCWCDPDTTAGNDGIWAFTPFANGHGSMDARYSSNNIIFTLRDGGGGLPRTLSVAHTAENKWSHQVYIFDSAGDTNMIYIDGIQVAGLNIDPSDCVNIGATHKLIVGGYYGSGFTIDGNMAMFQISTNVWSAAEILETNISPEGRAWHIVSVP